MNNEIIRKLTSLTLMTIMIAGGLTFSIPAIIPQASATNANLFVSAENSQFANYFAGPMIVEVVIIDSMIGSTNTDVGEPNVTVNGKGLRMAQASDGNWYGYFVDKKQAQIADEIQSSGATGSGLDFGAFCSSDTDISNGTLAIDLSGSAGISVPSATTGSSQGTDPITSACTISPGDTMNVLRQEKALNNNDNISGPGQIDVNQNAWPFIQLYDFTAGSNVVVQYNKGNEVQNTILTFSSSSQFASLDLDRAKYPQGSQVNFTITDQQLNIDPTDIDSWTFGTEQNNLSTHYLIFNKNGEDVADTLGASANINTSLSELMFSGNGILSVNADAQGSGDVINIVNNNDQMIIGERANSVATVGGALVSGTQPITITEIAPNAGIFTNYDETNNANIVITEDADRGTSATINYNGPQSVLVGYGFATIDMNSPNDKWSSGEKLSVVLVDSDANKNTRISETLSVNNSNVSLIPALSTGDPFTLGESGVENNTKVKAAYTSTSTITRTGNNSTITELTDTGLDTSVIVQKFSERAMVSTNNIDSQVGGLVIDLATTAEELRNSIQNPNTEKFNGTNLFNYDISSIVDSTNSFEVYLVANANDEIIDNEVIATPLQGVLLFNTNSPKGLVNLNSTQSGIQNPDDVNELIFSLDDDTSIGLYFNFGNNVELSSNTNPIVADFFTFGFNDDGIQSNERIANQIVRFELSENGANTSTFEGTVEYIMINQLNVLNNTTYNNLNTISGNPKFIVNEDLRDEDAPRINYYDLGADGVYTQIADQKEAISHSGVISLDSNTYKVADTVLVTLEDQDLNQDNSLIEIYTVVRKQNDPTFDTVGTSDLPVLSFGPLGKLVSITFDDEPWASSSTVINGISCTDNGNANNDGLGSTGFTLIETGPSTGIFEGNFKIPETYCARSQGGKVLSVTGTDIEVNYFDFRDESGEIIEVSSGAGIRAHTGSISLDRTVYPVPWGEVQDFDNSTSSSPNGRSIFPTHVTGIDGTLDNTDNNGTPLAETLGNGDLTIHVRINDPDFDVSSSGEDAIESDLIGKEYGPVKVTISRGSDEMILAYAGGSTPQTGLIDVDGNDIDGSGILQLGAITEIAPDRGIFELDFVVKYTDGPASRICPDTNAYTALDNSITTDLNDPKIRFDDDPEEGSDFCILQGDIITVEYTDPTDASGDPNTVTDSATFDLRNGVLQSDKSVYIVGSDMILTIIEPDWDLDNDTAETYTLDIVEWSSDAATVTMGNAGKNLTAFDPEPTDFRETGDSTGIFQTIIEIPEKLSGDSLERGEKITLEYTDWGPSGSDYVGEEDEDINISVFTSNFGATVELDQKVYTWNDKVYITVVAPDHNFDANLIDEIGDSDDNPIKISTRGNDLNNYKLVETGTNTGIFTGELILTGFNFDADGNTNTGEFGTGFDTKPRTDGTGPTDGYLQADNDDGITVSFEYSEDETVVGSALVRWNIGEVQWLEASYPASGNGVVRVIDPDMNLNPEAVDNFDVDVWSDSDSGGVDLTVTETNEATGIFEGTVFFTTSDESSGHRLRVTEGDTITVEYEDNTLPDPYTTADELDITSTAIIGTIVPPLERAPASNAHIVDAFGNSLDEVSVDQQVQITSDLTNNQNQEQQFAYLVQVQDENGVTVSLAWITGSLSSGQTFSPALSWIPSSAGTYTATAFVWESVDNPTALSPTVTVTINVI